MSERVFERTDVTTDRRPARRGLPGTSHWAVLLAGPIVGTAYFFLVYLLAEVSCAEETALLSTRTLRLVIVAAAVVAAATLCAYAWRGRQLWRSNEDPSAAGGPWATELASDRRDNRRFMVTTGLLLLGMFVLFVLFLAAPTLGGALC